MGLTAAAIASDRPKAPWGIRLAALGGILFLHLPLALIILYAFSAEEKSYIFPPPGLTLKWFPLAFDRPDLNLVRLIHQCLRNRFDELLHLTSLLPSRTVLPPGKIPSVNGQNRNGPARRSVRVRPWPERPWAAS